VTARKPLLIPLALGFALATAGLLLLNGTLIATAIPALLFVCVRLLSSPRPVAHDLRIERSLSQSRAIEGDRIEIELLVENAGTSHALVSITDAPPAILIPREGHTQTLGRLPAGEARTLTYVAEVRRGLASFNPVAIRSWSPWGLTSTEADIPIETTIKAHPRYELLDPITIRPRRTRAFAGPVKANRGGQGLDFFGCRAYTPGDDVRRINWRAYARGDALMVNEYDLERIADVNVILDARARAHAQLDEETTFDHSVRAAAALACHFLDQGNNVGLLIYGDYIQWVFSAIGRVQKERILDELAEAQMGDKSVFEELRFIPTRLFPPRSQLVLVSPLADEDDIETVALLADRGYSVLLVCPHTLSLGAAAQESLDEASLAMAERILTLRRELFLGSLSGIGTSVIDWRVDEPLRVACQGIHHARMWRHQR